MRVKLLFFGEAVNIPKTSIGLGVGAISVWVDGQGFTSATNDLGALGYVFLETQEVDLGDVSEELQQIFANLHGQVVDFEIKVNIFVSSGGIARIKLTRNVEQGGVLVPKTLEFQASNCKGICFSSNAFSFSVEMLQLEQAVAMDEGIVSENELVAIVDAAPPDQGVG